jgi:UDP-glucose 4-epimerase
MIPYEGAQVGMRCLVLGGGGFQGSHLSEALLKAGYAVRIFEKRNVCRDNIAHLMNRVDWCEGDYSDSSQLDEAVRGADYVFHLVSTTLPKHSNENMTYDISSNVIATLNLLEISRKREVKKIIFFSSGGTVYGVPNEIPIKEEHHTNPICSYGIHKLAIEKYLSLFHYLYGAEYAVLRISNPYGDRQGISGDQGAVAVFSHRALKNEPIEIWGDGSVVRDYLHISDVIRAAVAVLDYRGNHRIFNIGSGAGMSLNEVVSAIERSVGYPLRVQYKPARPLDVPVNILDISLARNVLGWRPEVSFADGLAMTVASLRRALH